LKFDRVTARVCLSNELHRSSTSVLQHRSSPSTIPSAFEQSPATPCLFFHTKPIARSGARGGRPGHFEERRLPSVSRQRCSVSTAPFTSLVLAPGRQTTSINISLALHPFPRTTLYVAAGWPAAHSLPKLYLASQQTLIQFFVLFSPLFRFFLHQTTSQPCSSTQRPLPRRLQRLPPSRTVHSAPPRQARSTFLLLVTRLLPRLSWTTSHAISLLDLNTSASSTCQTSPSSKVARSCKECRKVFFATFSSVSVRILISFHRLSFELICVAFPAPRLVAGFRSTVPFLPPSSSLSSSRPDTLHCRFYPSRDAIPPTHFISLPILPPDADSPELRQQAPQVLFPLHALPFALASTTLARVIQASIPPHELADWQDGDQRRAETSQPPFSPPPTASFPPTAPPYPSPAPTAPSTPALNQTPELSPPSSPTAVSLVLPILSFPPSIPLPTRRAFETLHRWVYSGGDVDELWASLVDPPLPPSNEEEGETAAERRKEEEDARQLLRRIVDLWRAVVALEVYDEQLWKVMEAAWETVVAEVERGEEEEQSSGSEMSDDEEAVSLAEFLQESL
jgi:hypothetical protein